MSRRSQRTERVRRWRGWLIPAALLALAPKCILCALAYAGLGAAFGLGGPELCGTADSAAPWVTTLPLLGLILGAGGWLARRAGLFKARPVPATRPEALPDAPTRQRCR